MTDVPVIDLAGRGADPAGRRRVATAIDEACREIGSFAIDCLPLPGPARPAPVLSGEYRDTKYAKTGLTPPVVS
jgi:hypothetical protein